MRVCVVRLYACVSDVRSAPALELASRRELVGNRTAPRCVGSTSKVVLVLELLRSVKFKAAQGSHFASLYMHARRVRALSGWLDRRLRALDLLH